MTDPAGKALYESDTLSFIRRSYLKSDGDLKRYDFALWGGQDVNNVNYFYPDGEYTVTVYATPAFEGAERQSLTYTVTIDTVFPKLTDCVFSEKDGRRYLTITVADNDRLQGVSLYTADGAFDIDTPLSDDSGAQEHTLTFDITDAVGRYLYVDLLDAAYNLRVTRIRLN